LIGLLAGGCGGGGGEEDPAEHACEHVGMAGTAITASAMRDASAPMIAFTGDPYTVTLPTGATGFVRVVTTEPETAGIMLFDAADVLAGIQTQGGMALTITSAGADEFCPTDIPEHFDIDFETVDTFFVELGPTASNRTWLILASGEGHVHME
jgi:hypothetical protein